MEEDIFDSYLAELEYDNSYGDFEKKYSAFLLSVTEGALFGGMILSVMYRSILPMLFGFMGILLINMALSNYMNSKKIEEVAGKMYLDSIVKAGSSIFPITFNVVAYEPLMLPEKMNKKEISYSVEQIEEAKTRVRDTIRAMGTGIYTQAYLEEKERESIYNIDKVRNDLKVGIYSQLRILLPIFIYGAIYWFIRVNFLEIYLGEYSLYINLIGLGLLIFIAVKLYKKYFYDNMDESYLEKYEIKYEEDTEDYEDDIDFEESSDGEEEGEESG